MKKLLSIFMAAAVLVAAGFSEARAADTKPIAAISVASYNDLVADVNYIGGLADRPQLGSMLECLLSVATQGMGLKGVDKTRHGGAILEASSETDVAGYVFIPITDFKDALDLLKLYNEVDAKGDVYKLTPKDGKNPSYVKENGKWACFSDKAENLAHLAADPSSLIGSIEKNYIIAGRVFLKNVPESLREKFMTQFKSGVERDAGTKKDDETDEQFAQRKKFVEQAETYITRVLGDLDQINIGWGLDKSAEKTYVDLSVTAKEGTKTAEEMAAGAQAKTNFAGFRPADAASMWAIASPIPEAKQALASSLIDLVRDKALSDIGKNTPENKREAAKSAAGNVFEMLSKIVKSGRVDGVITGLLSSDSATILSAFYVADGSLFDKTLHTVVKAIQEEHPEIDQFVKLDTAKTAAGLNIHKISIPIPQGAENRENIVKLIGETLEVVIAVGKEDVFVAAGRDAGAKLKKAVEASTRAGAKSVSLVAVSYSAKPVAGIIAQMGKPQERPIAEMALEELKKSPGKDHITFTGSAIANGGKLHLEVEKGVLRTFGRIVVAASEGKLKQE